VRQSRSMAPSVNPTIAQMPPMTSKTLGRAARGGGRSIPGLSGITERRSWNSLLSVTPGTLTVMTTSTDVLPVRPTAEAGGLAGLGLAGWLGTMSSHTARAYEGDLRQFTGWPAVQQISSDRVTPGVVTAWLAQLEAAGQSAPAQHLDHLVVGGELHGHSPGPNVEMPSP